MPNAKTPRTPPSAQKPATRKVKSGTSKPVSKVAGAAQSLDTPIKAGD